MIHTAGHLHDGGQNVQILVDGQISCDSAATYGGSPEYIEKPSASGHSHGHGGSMKHISKMSQCFGDSLRYQSVQPGQKWELRALYDYKKNNGMVHADGKQDHVMGIAIAWVQV
jgi:hypothetical protein